MAITTIKPTYRIEKPQIDAEPNADQELELQVAKIFEGTRFSQGSDHLSWPEAVKFASESLERGVLQSAREAAGWRIAAQGKQHADKHQLTRTTAVYVKMNGKWYIAIDDIADPEKNIILTRAQELYDAHDKEGKCVLPKDDPYVKGILERAEKADRIVEVHEEGSVRYEEGSVKLSTAQKNGKSDFGQHATNQAIFQEVAEPHAQYLKRNYYDPCHCWTLTTEGVERLHLKDNEVEVRGVSLGGKSFFAYTLFNKVSGGSGRGTHVQRKTSTP